MNHRFTLSAFADEISPDLSVQLEELKRHNIPQLDLRNALGQNVSAMTEEVKSSIRDQIQAAGITVNCIGSPVNKCLLNDESRSAEMTKLAGSIQTARFFGVRAIRVFSPEAEKSKWPEVRDWMAEQIDYAAAHDILLLHENDAEFYGAFPDGCRQLMEELGGPNFRMIYDFANPVLIGFRAKRDWMPWMVPHLEAIHIKDAIESERKIVPAGEGDGEIAECLQELADQGWSGALSLEPHLAAAGPMSGFSGPDLFAVAVDALNRILKG